MDMEPKVIEGVVSKARRSGTWRYEPKRTFARQSGSANNWAYGYSVHGRECQDDIINKIRQEVELCDNFGGFLLLQSLAGGTGSGVGTYVSEVVRDEFPSAFLLNHAVWPYESGEVIVQSYNAALALSHLSQVSDGVILVENENFQRICTQLLSIKRPSFADLNRVIGRQIATVLLPAFTDKSKGYMWLSDALQHMFSHPGYKLSTCKLIPQVATRSKDFNTFSWQYLCKHLLQMQIAGAFMEEGINWRIRLRDLTQSGSHAHSTSYTTPSNLSAGTNLSRINRAYSSMVVLRGKESATADITGFHHPDLHSPLSIDPLLVARDPTPFGGDDRTAVIWSTSQSVVQPLEKVVTKVYDMYTAGAYIHHYEKYGLGKSDFRSALLNLEQILNNYKNL